MRVLHIWNTAGVGSIISRELNKIEDIECRVVAKKNKFNFDTGETISVRGEVKYVHFMEYYLQKTMI